MSVTFPSVAAFTNVSNKSAALSATLATWHLSLQIRSQATGEHYSVRMHNSHELGFSAAFGACAIVLRISK